RVSESEKKYVGADEGRADQPPLGRFGSARVRRSKSERNPTGLRPEATARQGTGESRRRIRHKLVPRLRWEQGALRSRHYGFPFLRLTTTCWSLFGDED